MKKTLMLMGLILSASLSAKSGEMDIYGLNFNAPTVNGKANVSDPRVGEILFDSSDSTFYGNADGTSTGWKALSSTYQLLTATSSAKTPTGSALYHNLSNNSVTLTTGKWRVWCSADFDNNGTTPTYSYQGMGLYGANGSDSGTIPSALTSVSGLTVLSAGFAGLSSFGPGTLSTSRVTTPISVLQCASSCPIYCVSNTGQVTSANARIVLYLNAEKID